MSLRIITTGDGSSTIYHTALNEHYHSTHGAMQESLHVFIRAGLLKKIEENNPFLNILEVGLGTGLNVLLTLRETSQPPDITYTALEPFPLHENMISQLNFEDPRYHFKKEWIQKIHASAFYEWQEIETHFHFKKQLQKLEDAHFPLPFDLVYFDAFSPVVAPAIWSPGNFNKLHAAMCPGGLLVTYCAKGIVRRTLIEAGFTVERLQGPPGKREMLRAMKK